MSKSLNQAEREDRIARYARGAEQLKAALARVPEEARKWRPGPGKWSAHEVVCHCADSELNAAARIRYLTAEKDPVLVGYDQDEWARRFDYHQHPLETALQTVEAVRANTVALLRRLPDDAWTRVGRHTESGPYAVADWLDSYAEHLEKHSAQIDRNLAAWKASKGGAKA
jgi:DinB family protein